ncbi:MAG: hypothetical protein QNJ42_25745 [Crocosphaera sp.]|nr:hypothetical protein [Crocosphaera sp.]
MFIGYNHLLAHAVREITKHTVKHTIHYFRSGDFERHIKDIQKSAKKLEQDIDRGIDDTWKAISGKKK